MARAPRPGAARKAKESAKALEITVRGEPVVLAFGMLGPRDDALVRRETLKTFGYKISLRGVLREMDDDDVAGFDTIALLWWLARRKAGDTDQPLSKGIDEFPTFGEMRAGKSVLAARMVDLDDDSEEADDGSPEA